MKKERQTKRDVAPAVSQSHRHRRLMFALPCPHEFLCCICHAKIPHQQLHATHCLRGFLIASLHATPFLSKADASAHRRDWPPGGRASPPGRCVGEAGGHPAGGVRPNPPGLSTLLCPGGVVIDKFALGTEHRSKSGKKTARGGDGTVDNIKLQPLAGDRLGLQPRLSPARSRPLPLAYS